MDKSGTKTIAQNRKAYHDYFVEDRYEAGIELFGTEVKSIRAGTLNLKDSYCVVKNGEAMVYSMHISPYDKGNIFNKDPLRPRRLLMHKREIMRLFGLGKTQVRRFALTHGVRTKRIHDNRLYYLKADWDEARKVSERKSASTKAKREPDNESDNN